MLRAATRCESIRMPPFQNKSAPDVHVQLRRSATQPSQLGARKTRTASTNLCRLQSRNSGSHQPFWRRSKQCQARCDIHGLPKALSRPQASPLGPRHAHREPSPANVQDHKGIPAQHLRAGTLCPETRQWRETEPSPRRPLTCLDRDCGSDLSVAKESGGFGDDGGTSATQAVEAAASERSLVGGQWCVGRCCEGFLLRGWHWVGLVEGAKSDCDDRT